MVNPLDSLGPVIKDTSFNLADLDQSKFADDPKAKLHLNRDGHLCVGKRSRLVRFINALWSKVMGNRDLIELRSKSETEAFRRTIILNYKDIGALALREVEGYSEKTQLDIGFIQDTYRSIHAISLERMRVGQPSFEKRFARTIRHKRQHVLSNSNNIHRAMENITAVASNNHKKPLMDKELKFLVQFVLHHGCGAGVRPRLRRYFPAKQQEQFLSYVQTIKWEKN